MPLICFLIATPLEAREVLKDATFKWLRETSDIELYRDQFTGNLLCITGVGPVRSAFSMGLLVQYPINEYINLGVAGALKDAHLVGSILEVGDCLSAFERHPFDRKLDKLPLSESGLVCLSVGEALHDDRLRHKYAKRADLVDMELYALGCGAILSERKLRSFKIVSDFAQAHDAGEIVLRIPLLMSSIWAYFLTHHFP